MRRLDYLRLLRALLQEALEIVTECEDNERDRRVARKLATRLSTVPEIFQQGATNRYT